MLTKSDLINFFVAMDVNVGKTVLVHSSYKSFGVVEGGPQSIIDVLLELVGSNGTLLFPTFNFTSWTENHYFDIFHSVSQMGILTEMARYDRQFKRTKHPIYSFVVAGSQQNEFCDIDSENCFGEGSVFDLLYQNNALMLSLGLAFNDTFSLTHHVEKISGACTYRFDKPFSGIYVGNDKKSSLKTYFMTVRDVFRGVTTDIEPAMTKMVDEGVIVKKNINGNVCHFSYAKNFQDRLINIVQKYPSMLHKKRF